MKMDNFQTNPLKLYIQDIFRAKRTEQNKYIYELFRLTFKNIMIHGVVTSIYNNYGTTTNFELSDATGSVQVYFDTTKSRKSMSDTVVKDLSHSFTIAHISGDERLPIIRTLHKSILSTKQDPIKFKDGEYVSVIGDIFVDEIKNTRMVSAYEVNITSVQSEIIWLEELKYLYEKYYIKR